MTSGQILPCKACFRTVEWHDIDGKMIAFDFDGLGKRGPEHMQNCTNPDYFIKKEKKKKDKYMTESRKKLIEDPWWQK